MADIALVLIIALFMLWGSKRGLIRTLVGAASTLLSLILSMVLYRPVSQFLYSSSVGDSVRAYVNELLVKNASGNAQLLINDALVEAASMIVMNVISFGAVIIIVKIAVSLLACVANITAKLPVLKQANSLLGMAAGALSGILVCYIVIGIVAALGGNEALSGAAQSIEKSYLAINLYEDNIVAEVLSGFINK